MSGFPVKINARLRGEPQLKWAGSQYLSFTATVADPRSGSTLCQVRYFGDDFEEKRSLLYQCENARVTGHVVENDWIDATGNQRTGWLVIATEVTPTAHDDTDTR